jgi:hypothetical protein
VDAPGWQMTGRQFAFALLLAAVLWLVILAVAWLA